ncbi:MAG: hypothetical protein IJI57_08845 [Flexilinea sp.]|nr:hypothetical protein [Flexilinea sp.]
MQSIRFLPEEKRSKRAHFFRNEQLTEVIIPDAVTHIEHRAFENCRNLIIAVCYGII